MQAVENAQLLVFDLGGVMVNLDMKGTLAAFAKIGVTNLERYVNQSQALDDDVFERFGRGLASEAEFYNKARQLSSQNPTDSQIRDAWNTMIAEFPQDRVRLIERLKQTHRVVLLSNTNILHFRKFDSMADGYNSLSELFHRTYYSHEMHLAKPDPEIFRQMLKAEAVDAEKAVFFDDSQANVDAARSVGMQAFRVTDDEGIVAMLS